MPTAPPNPTPIPVGLPLSDPPPCLPGEDGAGEPVVWVGEFYVRLSDAERWAA